MTIKMSDKNTWTIEKSMRFYEGLAALSLDWDIEKIKQKKEKHLKTCKAEAYDEIAKNYEVTEKLYSLSVAVREWLEFTAKNPYKEHDFDEKILSIFEELKILTEELKNLQNSRMNNSTAINKSQETTLNERLNNNIETLINIAVENTYPLMRNGIATNELAKTPSKKKIEDNFDALTGIATFKGTQHNFLAIFENFSEIKGLKNSTKKLLDALMIKFTSGNSKNLIVKLPLAEYMKMRGLNDEKEARKQAKEDLETLSKTTLTFTQEIKGKAKDFVNLKIIGTHGIKNGIISASFDVAFHALILNYQVMPMPLAFLALNDKRFPSAYPLGRRIALHKNINRVNKTGNEDIISVQTLLEACPDIPTKEELSRTTRHYKDKIIKPFENGMDELEKTGIFSWEYCHSNKEPLTDSELENLNYETFINLLVKITWNNYPDNLLPEKEKKSQKKPTSKMSPKNKK